MSQMGWIKLHRKITECEIWLEAEPFSKRDAWIDLLLTANHTTKKIVMGNQTIEVKPGQRITSQAKLAERWHWGIGRVRRYLDLLQDLGMITWEAERKWTVINVLKYEVYQLLLSENGTTTERERNDNGATTETNNNDKNIENDKENTTNVVVVSKDISKGSSYSPLNDVQYTLGFFPSSFQAQIFKDLYEEVGEIFFHKALVKAAKADKKNINYVTSVARGLAAGVDYDNKRRDEVSYEDRMAALRKKYEEEANGNRQG